MSTDAHDRTVSCAHCKTPLPQVQFDGGTLPHFCNEECAEAFTPDWVPGGCRQECGHDTLEQHIRACHANLDGYRWTAEQFAEELNIARGEDWEALGLPPIEELSYGGAS